MRFFLGVYDAAGYLARLADGLRACGHHVEYANLADDAFAYSAGKSFAWNKRVERFALGAKRSSPAGIAAIAAVLASRLVLLFTQLRKTDVFVFTGFDSFLRFVELPLLRLVGKQVVVVYLGSDARPPYMSGKHLDDVGGVFQPRQALRDARKLRARIRRVERWASHIINHTGTAQFFSRPFVRLFAVGLPFAAPLQPDKVDRETCAIRIVHAPSRPIAKGTDIFRRAVEQLRSEGHAIEFRELVGLPNSVVLQELAACDFVVDEMYSDVPMAMLATEAGAFGKPVVVAGYYAQAFDADNPGTERPPSLYVAPEDVTAAMRRLLEDEPFRLSLGRAAARYVTTNLEPIAVARRLLRIIDSGPPADWMADPHGLGYIHGWGLHADCLAAQLARYVQELGAGALLLEHNPTLERRALDQASAGLP